MEIQVYYDQVTEVIATSDPEVAFKGVDVAVLLGGFPRLQGMQRRDLVGKNVPIMAEHGAALAKCAKKSVRVLVVANPACTNCLVVSRSYVVSAAAPSIPRSHFSSLARLDQDRLSAMVAEEVSSKISRAVVSDVSGRISTASPPTTTPTPTTAREQPAPPSRVEIRGTYLWGNHSPTMWPDVSRAEAKVKGRWVPINSALRHRVRTGAAEESSHQIHAAGESLEETRWREWVSRSLVPAVRNRGTRVIEARGKSSAMSAANAIANHLRDWLSSPAAAAPAASAATVRDENENSRRDGTQNKEDGGDEARGEEAREKEEEEEEEREGGEREKDEKQKDEKEKNEKDGAAVAGVGVSMGVFSDGNPYGVPDGLVFSFPVDCGEGRHRVLEGFCPDREMLEASTQELLEEREEAFETLRESGLLGPGY
eukprot:jgi/Undpi1/12740/HiC_scaffold_6.g02408.m1